MLKTSRNKSLLILLFLHLVIALPLAYYLNIWVDEASSLHTTQYGFLHAWGNVLSDEKQAPLYFLILSIWREFNHSIFFARLFSILCSLAAIKFFYDSARKIWNEHFAFFAAAFFALHPYLVWASLEIRLYSLIILISVWLLDFFREGYLVKPINSSDGAKSSKKARIFYVITAVAAIYTNYYLGFLLVGNFFALLVLRRWRDAKSYFLQMLAVGTAILPILYFISRQFAVRVVDFQPEKTFYEGLQNLWNHFLTFVLPTELFPTDEVSALSIVRIWIIRIALAVVCAFIIKSRGKILDEKIVAFGTTAATAALFFLFVYFQLGASVVEIRHAAVFFTVLILFVFSVLEKILPRRSLPILAVLCAMFFTYALAALYPNLAKRGDWARVGAFLEQNEKPRQPIVLFQTYDVIALPYYYSGVNKILPDRNFFAYGLEDKPGSSDSYRSQIEFTISVIPPDANEIWLLTGEKCAVEDSCLPLENFVQTHYTVVEEKNFYLEKVRLLRKKNDD